MIPTQSLAGFTLPDYAATTPEQWHGFLAAALERAQQTLQAIGQASEAPTFTNTFEALERALYAQAKDLAAFVAAKTPHATEAMQDIAAQWVPKFLAFHTALYQDAALFARCQAVSQAWSEAPEAERRLMDKHLLAFRRAGMGLTQLEQIRLTEIASELATLQEKFQECCQQAIYKTVVLPEAAALGLSAQDVAQARAQAQEQGQVGLAFSLLPSSVEACLSVMQDRESREQLWRACQERGTGVRDEDTSPLITQILQLRLERAQILGFPFAARQLMEETMAKTPASALGLLAETWEKLRPALERDLDALRILATQDGLDEVMPWDVAFYVERYRQAAFAVDTAQLRAYLPLSRVRTGAFEVASKLFGIAFEPEAGTLYHPAAQIYRVRNRASQETLGLLVVDDLARPTKMPGAWMDELVPPSGLDAQRPVVLNVCNFPPPTAGQEPLLDMEDALTVFHELGHALHSLLTRARYPTQASTRVAQDFVELPSQVLENWLREPEGFLQIARHHQTGEAPSLALMEGIEQAGRFGQSFYMAQYLASAYVDVLLHDLDGYEMGFDLAAFERNALATLGMPPSIAPRHGLHHFSHLFSGDDYASGYYSYLWAEVLEADVFSRFREAGLFDPGLGRALRETIFAQGGARDPEALFEDFMGRGPEPEALMRKHGWEAPALKKKLSV